MKQIDTEEKKIEMMIEKFEQRNEITFIAAPVFPIGSRSMDFVSHTHITLGPVANEQLNQSCRENCSNEITYSVLYEI